MAPFAAAGVVEARCVENLHLQSALDDFHEARYKAVLHELLARFMGQPIGLLSYEEVRQTLKAQAGSDRGLHDIPLAAIVGSVNRYEDFTRDFLPRQGIVSQRWARVKAAAEEMAGLPPIEVYQLGEAYFVKDGNHRVSVARLRGDATIQAYVTEVKSAVQFKPSDSPDALILKGEYASFLERTCFDELRPQADLQVTSPGQYAIIEEHIHVHRHYMGQDFGREVPLEEAVAHWYDTVYLPVVRVLRQRNLLQDFPQRTETDLYLWLAEYRAQLESELGMGVSPEAAADGLVSDHSPRPERVAARLIEAVTPAAFENGPPIGYWRREKDGQERLFKNVLVALGTNSTCAIEQALILARLDGSHLNGLHVTASEAEKGSPTVLMLRDVFERRCREENIANSLTVTISSNVTRKLQASARYNDLVIFNLSHPPAEQVLPRLSSGVRHLLQHSSTPIMTVPNRVSSLTHALLAYDGSPKGREALYLAAYLAKKWELSLSVVNIARQGRTKQPDQAATLTRAQEYLANSSVLAETISANGPIATSILLTTETSHCDLIIMGGYGRGPLLTAFIDDVVDQVLRRANCPVLLCR
jgi:nucleotide-binding universal stress UspA family protein